MKTFFLTASASALLFAAAPVTEARHGHNHVHSHLRRHQLEQLHPVQHRSVPEAGHTSIVARSPEKEKKAGQCSFPDDEGLVAVTPEEQNAGWAMSPDQPCLPDSYCPYACPPGQVSMQWDPDATEYTYPDSMNGGLYCDQDGKISKPFPEKPYCQDAKNGIKALNKAGDRVAFCQTVLPGNEAMLIPTDVEDSAELAVPGTDYWAGTAAHYYINPPGYSCDEACVWGSKDTPIGNWSPYVAGANLDGSGETFIKLGWNPIYLEPETPFRDEMPGWGVEIECDGDGCNGLPCSIDPAIHRVNEITGEGTTGAGGAAFCVVTVPKGVKANYVVFDGSGGGSTSSSGDGTKDEGDGANNTQDDSSDESDSPEPDAEEGSPEADEESPEADEESSESDEESSAVDEESSAVDEESSDAANDAPVEPYAQTQGANESPEFEVVSKETSSDEEQADDESGGVAEQDAKGAASSLHVSFVGLVAGSLVTLALFI